MLYLLEKQDMAIYEDLFGSINPIKGIGSINPAPIPTMEDLQNVASPFSISNVVPNGIKSRETQVPTVAQSANSGSFASLPTQSTGEQNFVNPFAGMNITPYNPMDSVFQPIQQPQADQGVGVRYGMGDTLIGGLLSNIFPQQKAPTQDNAFAKYYDNKSEIEKLTEKYKTDTSSPIGSLFMPINNAVFGISQGDLNNEITQAQNIIDIGGKKPEQYNVLNPTSKSEGSAYNIFDPLNKKPQEDINKSKEYLQSIKSLVGENYVQDVLGQDKRITSDLEDIGQSKMSIGLNKALFPDPRSDKSGIGNASVNAAEVGAFIRDAAAGLAPYQVNLERQLQEAEAGGNVEKADRIKRQMGNAPLIMGKLAEKVNWISEYKNKNPLESDYNAENAYYKYIQGLGYRNLSSYMYDGMVDMYGNEINKDAANKLSYLSTWKDQLNYINNTNEESIMSKVNLLGGYTVNPIARGINTLLRLASKIGPIGLGVDVGLPSLISQSSEADISNSYGIDYSNAKKSMAGDIVPYYLSRVSDVGTDAAANIMLLALTEGAGNIGQLKNLTYVDDAAAIANALTKISRVGRKTAGALAKTGLKEIAQNAFADSYDPNATSRGNMILNMYGSILGMGMEASQFARETNLLNSDIVRKSVNNRIRDIKVSEIAESKGISRTEAAAIFEQLPVKEKGFVSESEERLSAIQGLENLANKEKTRVQKLIDNAPESEKPVYIAEMNKLNVAEKNGMLEQALITKLYSDKGLSQVEAEAFARLIKDAQNPNVMIDDLARILRAQTDTKAIESLAGTITDIARTGSVKPSGNIAVGGFLYKDSGVASTYVNKSIGISPDGVYNLTDLENAVIKAADESKKDGTNILNSIMAKEGNEFKYFMKVGDNANPQYVLNKEGLNKLNVSRYSSVSEIQRTVAASGGSESFISGVKSKIDSGELGMSVADVDKLEKSGAYDKLLETIDTFIPCR